MTEANQMREFVHEINVRSELKPYLKPQKLEGHTNKTRNKCIIATADTVLSVDLVLISKTIYALFHLKITMTNAMSSHYMPSLF